MLIANMSMTNISRSVKKTETDESCKHFGISARRCRRVGRRGLRPWSSFWPICRTCVLLMTVWNDDPNYTHGYLVIPIALFILWQQLSSPQPKTVSEMVLAPWWGWVFLAAVSGSARHCLRARFRVVGECNHHSCYCGFDLVVW